MLLSKTSLRDFAVHSILRACATGYPRHRRGNRIYFGRYNSNSPVPGHEFEQNGKPRHQKINALVHELEKMDIAARAAARHAEGFDSPSAQDVPFFFPRLDGAEMRSRWDMQDAPPDILITNNSMLSIMMMRETDAAIFEKTREWLEESSSVFHLIVDELHLYRGTAGTEIAYLLRLLLDRLGLHPGSPKLRVLASSASLDSGDTASRDFLAQFFGCDWLPAQIVTGALEPIPSLPTVLRFRQFPSQILRTPCEGMSLRTSMPRVTRSQMCSARPALRSNRDTNCDRQWRLLQVRLLLTF